MRFIYEHPEWALRDCDECRKYIFSGHEIVRDGSGSPLGNPVPPACEATPCLSREGKPRLWAESQGVFYGWRLHKATGHLPRPGGLDDQDATLMDLFLMLTDLDADYQARQRGQLARSLGPLAFLLGAR
ncbi:MAG TPA: hypothetical protein VM487_18580 [Phycisphaerae bacterium]|nr:hypothetical protein [Phycisphaerae bacterium]